MGKGFDFLKGLVTKFTDPLFTKNDNDIDNTSFPQEEKDNTLVSPIVKNNSIILKPQVPSTILGAWDNTSEVVAIKPGPGIAIDNDGGIPLISVTSIPSSLISKGLVYKTPNTSYISIKGIADAMRIALPPDGTLCKFTLVGAGAGGTNGTASTVIGIKTIGGSGGGAGGACIWYYYLNQNAGVMLDTGGGSEASPTGETKFISDTQNPTTAFIISATGGKTGVAGSAGGIGGDVIITNPSNTRFIYQNFRGGSGNSSITSIAPNVPININGAGGGVSIFGGAGGAGSFGRSNQDLPSHFGTPGGNGTGAGGGGARAQIGVVGGAGGSGVFIIEW